MSFVPPWNEVCTPEGGLAGGMKGLVDHMKKKSLPIDQLRTHYSAELAETLSKLLAKSPKDRLPLKSLISQLTDAPVHPASWGLSAEAQAALDAANGSATSCASSSAGTATPPLQDELRDDEVPVKGVESHVAAISLQRSFRRNHAPARPGDPPAPGMPPKPGGPQKLVGRAGAVPSAVRTGAAPKLRAPSPRPNSQPPSSRRQSSPRGMRPPSAKGAAPAMPRKATPSKR